MEERWIAMFLVFWSDFKVPIAIQWSEGRANLKGPHSWGSLQGSFSFHYLSLSELSAHIFLSWLSILFSLGFSWLNKNIWSLTKAKKKKKEKKTIMEKTIVKKSWKTATRVNCKYPTTVGSLFSWAAELTKSGSYRPSLIPTPVEAFPTFVTLVIFLPASSPVPFTPWSLIRFELRLSLSIYSFCLASCRKLNTPASLWNQINRLLWRKGQRAAQILTHPECDHTTFLSFEKQAEKRSCSICFEHYECLCLTRRGWDWHSNATFWKTQGKIQRSSYCLWVRKEDIGWKGTHACSAG